MNWIQRLIATGPVEASAPLVARTYQELSRGIVNLNNVRKIEEVPFPFPWKNIGTKTGNTRCCDVWHFRAFSMKHIMKLIAGKLRRIILLNFGPTTSRLAYGRTLKPLMFMISGSLDISPSPKTNIIYFLKHQNPQNKSIKIPSHF